MAPSRLLSNLGSFILPLTATVIVPWTVLGGLPSFDDIEPAHGVAGGVLIVAGCAILAWTVSLFVRIGRGTLAPWDPTRKLVILGPYAHVRNPMISGVLAVIVGEALAFGDWRLWAWAGLFLSINHVYFVLSEERGLAKRFGAEYDDYKRHVPRWIPRPR